jgi:hypothetical protein
MLHIFRSQYATKISRERRKVSRPTRLAAAVAHADVLGAEDVLWFGSRCRNCEQIEGAEDEEDGGEMHREYMFLARSVFFWRWQGEGAEKRRGRGHLLCVVTAFMFIHI